MNKLQLIFVLINILLISNTFAVDYQCEIKGIKGEYCYVENLQLTKGNSKIDPKAPTPTDIERVYFNTGNKIPTLSSGICDAFANLERFYAWKSQVEEIQADAFKECGKLELLELGENKIKQVTPAMFNGLANLEDLELYSNELTDLQVDDVVAKMPKLKGIWLADNDFKCSRLEEILTALDNKKVTVYPEFFHPRPRSYTPEKRRGIHCIAD
ncbi:uncharacterized protein LOC134828585 [Culicoides brevitarsis]|uniref:uncharacterized protein LOC134828585 n=1 Tax=Culicoides brevitarsis TaxID=469753 RepID=UPI00307BC6DF